ncbi:MAG: ribosome silencing factor [Acidimicrobiia bacterium]
MPRHLVHRGVPTDAKDRAVSAAQAACDKQAVDPIVLEVGEIIAITEYFVITGAPNARQVRTIVEEIERRIKDESGESPRSIEGMADASWVLLDYGDVIVHVFLGEAREYYDLERLWGDAPRVDWSQPRQAAGGTA